MGVELEMEKRNLGLGLQEGLPQGPLERGLKREEKDINAD
jgi:hypothetical protein